MRHRLEAEDRAVLAERIDVAIACARIGFDIDRNAAVGPFDARVAVPAGVAVVDEIVRQRPERAEIPFFAGSARLLFSGEMPAAAPATCRLPSPAASRRACARTRDAGRGRRGSAGRRNASAEARSQASAGERKDLRRLVVEGRDRLAAELEHRAVALLLDHLPGRLATRRRAAAPAPAGRSARPDRTCRRT